MKFESSEIAGISSDLCDDPPAEAWFGAVDGIRTRTRDFAWREGSDTWRTSRHRSMVLRKRVNTSATGVDPGRRRYPTPRRRSGRRGAGRRGRWRRALGMANGSRPLIGLIRSSCWRSRRLPACPSWCRSAMGGCSCRRSRSSAARPTRWRPIWPARPGPGWTCSSVATRICPTSVVSPGPIGGLCSASTISTRRCRAPSSGT